MKLLGMEVLIIKKKRLVLQSLDKTKLKNLATWNPYTKYLFRAKSKNLTICHSYICMVL
jgi:predicted transcriptional regulator